MPKAIIKIAYKHVIDSASESSFDKTVLNLSYKEYLLKSQAYNIEGKFKTFSELKANDGRANSLHYKSGFAISGLIETLNKQIPVLQDALGKSILFGTHSFEVIESDITDRSVHKVAITYITDSLCLFAIAGEYMILAPADKVNSPANEPVETFTLKMQENLSVVSYQESDLNS